MSGQRRVENITSLQEQISEYLGIKSFKRKYPEFYRRVCELEERDWLLDMKVVSITQCDLGLTALRSDDVIDLMSREYPSKYCDYVAVLDARKQESLMNATKGYTVPAIEKSKLGDFIKKAIKSVTEYNALINSERSEERSVCMDLQTYTIHYPIGLGTENRQLQANVSKGRVRTNIGRYPLAVVPGQYQDWYMKYTPEELKYLPLKSVCYGPVVDPSKLPPLLVSAEDSDSGSDYDSDSGSSSCCSESGCDHLDMGADGNCTTCGQGGRGVKRKADDAVGREGEGEESCSSDSSESSSESEDGPIGPPVPILMKELNRRPNAVCKICKMSAPPLTNVPMVDVSSAPKTPSLQKKSASRVGAFQESKDLNQTESLPFYSDELVHCSDCNNSSHPKCLELTPEMVDVIRSYPWQCSDCKTCITCSKSTEEEMMMFCDKCDRGYHTFCVGLTDIPTGKWVCRLCGQCAMCGSTDPVGDTSSGLGSGTVSSLLGSLLDGEDKASAWHHETIKILSPNGEVLRRHHLICQVCVKARKK